MTRALHERRWGEFYIITLNALVDSEMRILHHEIARQDVSTPSAIDEADFPQNFGQQLNENEITMYIIWVILISWKRKSETRMKAEIARWNVNYERKQGSVKCIYFGRDKYSFTAVKIHFYWEIAKETRIHLSNLQHCPPKHYRKWQVVGMSKHGDMGFISLRKTLWFDCHYSIQNVGSHSSKRSTRKYFLRNRKFSIIFIIDVLLLTSNIGKCRSMWLVGTSKIGKK